MQKKDCVFCKIIQKDIPANIVYEDDDILCFHDISPKAKTHLLIIPKRHIQTLKNLTKSDILLMGKLIYKIQEIAQDLKIENYNIKLNNGKKAGQEVFHIHFHLLSDD